MVIIIELQFKAKQQPDVHKLYLERLSNDSADAWCDWKHQPVAEMEALGADRVGFRVAQDFVHLAHHLSGFALLGDAIQRDSLRNVQVVEFPDQCEGVGVAGFEVDEEEGL